MPRPDRLLELVQLLGGRRSRTLKEIVDHFDISERTAYRDLAAIERRNIPVQRDEHGYRLLDTATLRPLTLTATERALLLLALDNPALRDHPHLARRLRTLRAKLDAVTRPTREPPRPLALTGPERTGPVPPRVLELLERATTENRRAEILYHSLSANTRRWRPVDPYALFHRAGAWYLAAHCHHNAEPRTFRLDRVEDARLGEERFDVPAEFDLRAYLAGAWTVVRGEGDYHVVLRFPPDLAPLVENARFHPGEEVEAVGDGWVEYRVRLSDVEEIARWVVGFGGRVEVVGPEELAGRVRGLAEGVLGRGG